MLDLAGAVALLIWGLRMVKTGVGRAFGPRLRHWIASGTQNRIIALCLGLAATLALQSSTATALMTAGFAGSGYMSSAMAQAIMLGANVGTSLVTRFLAFDIHWLGPLLIAAGVAGFTCSATKPNKSIARAVLGLGLMLLSLKLLGQSTEPMRQSHVLQALMASLDAVPALAVVVAAALALAASSSLVVVLLVMSLAATGTVDSELSVVLVLGANVGGAIPPVLATMADGPLARRVTIGNLLVRLVGCVIVLPLATEATGLLSGLTDDPAALVIDAHLLVNIVLAGLMLPLLDPLSALMHRLLPLGQPTDDGPRHLDPGILDKPAMALAAAARETLRMGDRVSAMLKSNLEALQKNDSKRCDSLGAMDDEVDRLNHAIKLYIATLGGDALAQKDERRATEIVAYATNLEHIGDIIDKNLRELVEKKIKNQLSFSPEGAGEIEALYRATLENLRLAQSILVSHDDMLARQLVEAKVEIRRVEERSVANHLNRLRNGYLASVQTSSLHLDILRDLKRINAHIAAIAYPILSEGGSLLETRLVDEQALNQTHA
ncbi:Na/Pi cotransporter family protein [Microvirga sp. VF16]|uniref:Na/Pi cotransporter family protein n=1 Tax=Microvirga sp. VF16 TaxID=2807101 RepID=UPI00193D2493|nr:Na/Pi cotransporter family protein [Microvirga sp. VF16]QRM32405.1 Na/Pi cotransporter family protein [Microvirga sp. VF16]